MEMKTLVLVLHLFFSLVVHSDSSSFNANPVYEQEKDRVVELPGLSFNVSFAHYSGYVTANEFSGRSLFYWFFEAVEDPSSKPIVLWLQGGPGCSSIGLGQAVELGPFHINPDGKTIHLNPYSWNQVANILFVDSPVGAGFSYSKTPHDLLTNGDKRTAEDSLMFLLNWFERFPQYKGRNFYIVGESYAGHYIPQLAQAIVRHQLSHSKTSINLKGYMVGNGLTDDYNDQRGVTEYMWSAGLISDQTYKLKTLHCTHVSYLYSSEECNKVAKIVTSELGNIDIYSVFTPKCTSKVGSSDKLSKRRLIARSLGDKYDPCSEEYAEVYFNLPEVQKALHVNPEAIPYKWVACSDVYKTWTDSASSVLDIYHELINSGLRVWIFSGDTDTVIPVTAARYNVEALNLPPAAPWHPWYDDEQVAGWTEQYVGLTFVSIKGAGHKVPMTKPKLALVLFKSFLSGSPMPTLSESSKS